MAALNDTESSGIKLESANTADYDQYPDSDTPAGFVGTVTRVSTTVDNKPVNRPIAGGFAFIPAGPVGGVRG